MSLSFWNNPYLHRKSVTVTALVTSKWDIAMLHIEAGVQIREVSKSLSEQDFRRWLEGPIGPGDQLMTFKKSQRYIQIADRFEFTDEVLVLKPKVLLYLAGKDFSKSHIDAIRKCESDLGRIDRDMVDVILTAIPHEGVRFTP